MAEPNSWPSHIEAFVDSSKSLADQNAAVGALAQMVKSDLVTLQALVKEMGLYLTTTDHTIRARGILLLGEILTRLTSKPLGEATISSLVGFFTSRLADWQALHGTLVGCLALFKRNTKVGVVKSGEAKMLAEAYIANVRAQSLAVHDRKLCFELLQCLLDVYPEDVMTLADELLYGILDAIDKEKDPRCLMLTFHIAERLVQIFADQSKLIESFAEELFEILSCYFPIYFTHQNNDDFEITRDDLSRALMNAFCSTPYFEPFAIPLLLDKLSSSLPLAKLDSLKYLNNCILHYGADRMFKHANAIWSALKDIIFDLSPRATTCSSASRSAGELELLENSILKEAFTCLQTAILQLNCSNSKSLISLILDDQDIQRNFESLVSGNNLSFISKENQHQLRPLVNVLSVATKVSSDSCSRVFQRFFQRLMTTLGASKNNAPHGCIADSNSNNLNIAALYLCVELLASCRDLTLVVQDNYLQVPDSWWYLLKDFSGPLSYVLRSALAYYGIAANTGPEQFSSVAVKGLQVLATLPGDLSLVAEEDYEEILMALMSAVTDKTDQPFLWRTALEAVVQIGVHISKFHESKEKLSYEKFVVDRTVSWLSPDAITQTFALKLKAISEIGMSGQSFMSKVIHGLEEAIFANFSEACVNGDPRAAELLVSLLDCYSNQLLPWYDKSGNSDHVAMQFAVSIWNLIEKSSFLNVGIQRQGVLDSTMMAMKCVVGYCTEENQGTLVRKAFKILSSKAFLLPDSLPLPLSDVAVLQSLPDMSGLSCKDEWIISLFASMVIAVRPQTHLPDVRLLVRLFIGLLLQGHVPAAQALASMINKWPADARSKELTHSLKLEEAIDMAVESLSVILTSNALGESEIVRLADGSFTHSSSSSFQVHAVVGLAWIGKSLLMRGHEKVKDVAMLLLKCLLSDDNVMATSISSTGEDKSEIVSYRNRQSATTRAAAEAFHIFLYESEKCLNKRFYATIRPLYKQRFFSNMLPVLLSSIKESSSPSTRVVLHQALGHIFSDTPLAALVAEAKKVIPPLLVSLSIFSLEASDKEMTYNLLLLLSGILLDENRKEAIIENAHLIISHLVELISYPHMKLVRETAIECLTAMSALPHTRIFPMRPKVLRALAMSLDDQKRTVRQVAVRCRQAWFWNHFIHNYSQLLF